MAHMMPMTMTEMMFGMYRTACQKSPNLTILR